MDRDQLNAFIARDDESDMYEGYAMGGPVGDDMSSEEEPEVGYFAEGGEVDQPPERGLFSQQRQAMPQRGLKRTAAEMLQRMPQQQLGTMRFSPLTMPGIAGRQVPRFAAGGEVDAEERAIMARQMDMGAPTENLFGANLAMPSLPPAVSFETNVPTFNPSYTPPTGPVTTPGTAGGLSQYPGLGGGADLQYQQSLYEQLSPEALAAPATTFTTATGYTPTAQTATTPTLLSREQAMLQQPTLVRYEPEAKFAGLTTYKGPLQTSPYTGGTTDETGKLVKPPLTTDRFALLGFRPPTNAVTGAGQYWFNPAMGYVYAPAGYEPEEGSGWTLTGPSQPGTINWTDTNFFATGNYASPTEQPRAQDLTDVFRLIGGSDVSQAAANLFKNPSYGWVPDPTNPDGGTFNMTPEAINNIRSSDPFKSATSQTLKNLYSELGYAASEQDVNALTQAISSGQTDIFRVANTITSPLRMSGQLQLTPDRPTLTSIYVNSGLTIPGFLNKAQIDAAYQQALGRKADNAGLLYYASNPSVAGAFRSPADLAASLATSREAQVQAAYQQAFGRRADAAGLAYYTSGGGKNVDLAPMLSQSREAQVRQAYSDVLKRAGDTAGVEYYTSGAGQNIPIAELRTQFGGGERPPAARAMGSPEEGEYADPMMQLLARQRMRRQERTMDQGSARDRLKKFLGGEGLTPVRMAEGGEVDAETTARQLYAQIGRTGDTVDEKGLRYWRSRIQAGQQSPEDLQKEFMAAADAADDPYFEVNRLYQRVGQTPDTEGFKYWVNRAMQDKLSQQKLGEQFIGGLPAITAAQQRPGFGAGGQYGRYSGLPMLYAPEVDRVLSGRQRVEGDVVNLDNAIGWDPASISGEIARGAASTGVYRVPVGMSGRQQYVGDLAGVARQYGIDPAQYTTTSTNQYGMQSSVLNEDALYNALDEKLKDYYAVQGYVPPAGTENSAFNRQDIGGDHARVMYQRFGDRLVPIEESLQYSNMQRAPKYSWTDYLAPAAILAAPFALPYLAPYFTAAGVAKGAAIGAGKNLVLGKDPLKGGVEGALTSFIPSPFAKGGSVEKFSKGGAVKKAADALKELVQAPSVARSSKLSELEKKVLEKEGKYGALRVQRAADEIKDLEKQYTEKALLEAFTGDNAKLLMTANPAEFQRFAAKLKEPYRTAVENYWGLMSSEERGASALPYLELNKTKGKLPFVSGHEGRHRNIAMAELGQPTTLWRMLPRAGLREDFPRGSREEYLEAMIKEIGKEPLVIPEDRFLDKEKRILDWTKARKLPELYAQGGPVHRAAGSPEYGEIAIGEGGITKDTMRGLKSKKGVDTFMTDSARMLRNVMGEGVSNLESAVRGSVAAIPGSVGDIESIFRESDKTRKFATTEEVLRDFMPKRLTKGTKEGKGFEEVGTYLPLPIPAGTVSKGVQTVGRAGERLAERNVPRIMERGGKGAKMLEAFSQNTTSNIRKPKGGNWLAGSFEDMLDRLRTPSIAGQRAEDRIPLHQTLLSNPNLSDESRAAAQEYLNRDLANVAIDRWINTKFANYLKNEMGTPEDPVRALAERGILHVDPTNLTYGRHTPFTNQLGQSNAARQWETATDYAINLHSPKEILEVAERGSISPNWAGTAKSTLDKNPWLSKLSPDTPVYSEWPGRADAHNLGFDHLLDELRSTVDPSTNLPQHLRWTPKDLEKVTVPQAVQRVAEINDWRAKQAMEAEKAGMMGNLQASPRRVNENFNVSFVDKPGGTWIDVPETVNDKNVNFCTSIGKAGGWCTMEATAAKRYGSGENRLTALLDAEGRPHLQAMITTRPIKTWDDVTETLGATEADKLWQEFTAIENRYVGDKPLDLDDFIKSKGIEAKPTITELKPPENNLQSERVKQYVKRDPEYRRKVTEAAVDFLNSGEWGKVKDLDLFDIIDLYDDTMLQAYVRGMHENASVARDTLNAALDANPNPPRFMTISQLRQFLEGGVPPEGTLRPPVGMSKGGRVDKKAPGKRKYI